MRGRPVHERAGELERGASVGEMMLDRLEGTDRDAELTSFLRVVGGQVEHALGEAALLGGDAYGRPVERGRECFGVDGRGGPAHLEQAVDGTVDRSARDQLDRPRARNGPHG